MTTSSTFAIVGGGLADDKAAEALHGNDFDGDDRVLAGMNVNIWEGLDDIKSQIRSRQPLGDS